MIGRAFKLSEGCVTYKKRSFHYWESRKLPLDAKILTAAFVQDARDKWYFTLTFETADVGIPSALGEVGIDLGLKALATMSDGQKIDAQRTSRVWAKKLSVAQRAGNKKRAVAIHAKITNVRNDFIHKLTTQIVRQNSVIRVGNVSSRSLAKTKMAKSVFDAGWGMLRKQLAYKSSRAQVDFAIVSERFTTQTCSCCGVIPVSSPKGMSALGIRHWECSDCGATHDRDVNSARNILRVGREHPPLVGGISAA